MTDDNTPDTSDAVEREPLPAPTDALALLGASSLAMATWTDSKKKDYVGLFKQRANASMYILRHTAQLLAYKAKEKQFVGTPRHARLVAECSNFEGDDRVVSHREQYHHTPDHEAWKATYDRSKTDLDSIVTERVKELFKNLPTLNKAMEILDAETFLKMSQRDALRDEGQGITDEFQELSIDIKMSELDQDMTIGAFRKHVKDLEAKRKTLLERLEILGKEGQALERHINKALFKGLPGIGEEIESVVRELYQQSRDLGVSMRSVENTVLYGDCEAALGILESFKADERALTTDIGKRFQNGLELLKLKISKTKKKKKEA